MCQHDDKYNMNRKRETQPFPHTEVRTKRGADVRPSDLADDLLNWLAWEFVEPESWPWVFRGTRKECYRLTSSLDRKMGDRTESGSAYTRFADAEEYLLSQFKKAAHQFHEALMVRDDNRLEWLALMQHYGTPTRLLDFTRSPYVACFFALEELPEKKDGKTENCAVWAVDTDWLVKNSFSRVCQKTMPPECNEDSFRDCEFLTKNFKSFFVKNDHTHLVLPIEPPRSNPRLLAQQGLFLCPSIAEAGFEKNLALYSDCTQNMAEHVLKVIVEGRTRTELLAEFRLMNISRATLFPDLQGYAESLAHELQYRSSDEIRRFR